MVERGVSRRVLSSSARISPRSAMVRNTRNPRANDVSSAASSGGRSSAVVTGSLRRCGRSGYRLPSDTAGIARGMKRRPGYVGATGAVRIGAIRLQRLRVPLDPPFPAALYPVPRTSFAVTIVRVETDEGVVGIGSADTMDGFEAFEHLFVGQDPLAIARHVRVLETIDFHAGRYWPLEAALWDIAGQVAGLPVATLFGGATDALPAYASSGMLMPAPERAESSLRLRDDGFRALKIRVDPHRLDEGLAAVTATRAAVGDSMAIMVDLNQGWRMAGDTSPSIDLQT